MPWTCAKLMNYTHKVNFKQPGVAFIKPKSHQKIGVKDQDLSGQLPNKKALGICWEIGDYAFLFKIKLT